MKISKYFILILVFCLINTHITSEVSELDELETLNSEIDSANVLDVAIIGSGPCGLCAAIYAARAKNNHAVITGPEEGGKLIKASYLENWPGINSILGGDLANNLKRQAQHLGANFIYDSVSSIDLDNYPYTLTLSNGNKLKTKSIIIGTGSKPNRLKCAGEERYFGKGIAICAYCDAPLFQGKKVVVVGGGYAALREIGIIKKYTNDITVINKETELTGPKMLQNYVIEDPSIKVLNNYRVLEILGNDNKVTGIKIKNKETNREDILDVDGVFISIGSKPNTKLFKDKLDLNAKGQIVVNHNRTSKKYVYAGGDVTDKSYHQAIMAASEGYACAMNSEKDLCETEECKNRKESFAI